MLRYPALIDGEKGAYGVTFPDLPGIVAMGETEAKPCLTLGKLYTITRLKPKRMARRLFRLVP